MRVLLLFLDGVGIGVRDPARNPFYTAHLPVLRSLLNGDLPHLRKRRLEGPNATLVPVDANLRVAGLPQSGTGQTAIFTGVNAPRVIGRHFGPYPTTDLRPILEQRNIFRQLKEAGKTVVFANAFPKQFFDYTNTGTRRLTATTLSCMMAGVPLLTIDELRRNEGVSADITRARWPEPGVPRITHVEPHEAGTHLARMTERHDFTLFEYWLTDHAGHSRDMAFAVDILQRFDAFFGGVLGSLDWRETVVLMISDHG
ncbi:MAG: metalloenzyme, partial [Bacteroidota bacterium]